MAQRQTVLGFFDTKAEAQQAVQLLLAKSFTTENVALSTLISQNTTDTGDNLSLPTEADGSNGRFSSFLFGSHAEIQSPSGTLGRMLTQSAAETKQVADLLDTAGAGDVAVNKRIDLGLDAVTHSTK